MGLHRPSIVGLDSVQEDATREKPGWPEMFQTEAWLRLHVLKG